MVILYLFLPHVADCRCQASEWGRNSTRDQAVTNPIVSFFGFNGEASKIRNHEDVQKFDLHSSVGRICGHHPLLAVLAGVFGEVASQDEKAGKRGGLPAMAGTSYCIIVVCRDIATKKRLCLTGNRRIIESIVAVSTTAVQYSTGRKPSCVLTCSHFCILHVSCGTMKMVCLMMAAAPYDSYCIVFHQIKPNEKN